MAKPSEFVPVAISIPGPWRMPQIFIGGSLSLPLEHRFTDVASSFASPWPADLLLHSQWSRAPPTDMVLLVHALLATVGPKIHDARALLTAATATAVAKGRPCP